MAIYPEQLPRYLAPLRPYYLIFGDDPWLVEHCRSQIHQAARKQGFDERIQFTQETGFDWYSIVQEWQALSLFSSRRIIELTLPQAKPGQEGANCFKLLQQQPSPDTVLIVKGPKLAPEQSRSKWLTSLSKQGVHLNCPTPEGKSYHRWLSDRITHFSLKFTTDGYQLLARLYEGNLLAADQALQLLQLLSHSHAHNQPHIQAIGVNELQNYFEDQSLFNAFSLSDALLDNQQQKVQHMLAQLKKQATPMAILLWAFFKELTVLLALMQGKQGGLSLGALWQQHKIWDKRKPLYQAALSRLSLCHVEQMLAIASMLERQLKQQGKEDWIGLSHLALLFDPASHAQLSHIDFSLEQAQ